VKTAFASSWSERTLWDRDAHKIRGHGYDLERLAFRFSMISVGPMTAARVPLDSNSRRSPRRSEIIIGDGRLSWSNVAVCEEPIFRAWLMPRLRAVARPTLVSF
jgi:hypothetical protein